jgi:hypothetical protein
MRAVVINRFFGLEEEKTFVADDIIEATPERIDKLESLGLVKRLDPMPSEYKVIEPTVRRGRPRKEV